MTTERVDKCLVLGWGLVTLAVILALAGLSLAIDANLDGRKTLTGALLVLWAMLPGFGGLILLLWRTKP